MTTRQRQAPGKPVAASAPAESERTGPFSLRDWFLHASPNQQAEALALARQQGLLYPHQLAASSNGVKSIEPQPESELATLVSRILAGAAGRLPVLNPASIAYFDKGLDEVQQQAVMRGLQSPDLFLLQGLPGTGKSRVIAEIVHQAAALGRRVLFLAPQPASLDEVLHRLVGKPEAFALRLLDTNEKPEALPAWLRGFTMEEQKQAFLERVLAGARGNRERYETNCKARAEHPPAWTELCALAAQYQTLREHQRHLEEQSAQIPSQVESDAADQHSTGTFAERIRSLARSRAESLETLDAAIARQHDDRSRMHESITDRGQRMQDLEPAFLAKKHGRFWTWAFWRSLFSSQVLKEMAALLAEQEHAQAGVAEVGRAIARLEESAALERKHFDDEWAGLIAQEIAVRQQDLARARQRIDNDRTHLDRRWNALAGSLDVVLEPTPDSVRSAQFVWDEKKKHDEEQCQFARQWAQFIEQAGPDLAARLPSLANVLAVSVQRWFTDARFLQAARAPFDLLILDDADAIPDAELVQLMRFARRGVLVAQAWTDAAPKDVSSDRPGRTLPRLWQMLGGNARHWPCVWQREHGRLVCQLMPLSDQDAQHLESESLADASDIELRILHRPRSTPRLAQVRFSPQHCIADAFQFMVREVQEFPLQPLGLSSWWQEEPHCLQWRTGPRTRDEAAALTLEPGVILHFAQDTRIGSIEFDKTAGWDRARAEDWLERRRGCGDPERTFVLQTPYRFSGPLAHLVGAVVQARDWLPERDLGSSTPTASFEFIAVPPLAAQEWPREGAGLEQDLSAARWMDRIPAALRHGLPARGYVNYPEAQALVRTLEAWAVRQPTRPGCQVAVLGLYAGQVELLRRLVEQSGVLRARSFSLEIALPTQLRQRECDVVFLSLTRSHTHRAVAFGENILDLPIGLTRARSALYLFGDAGSLCRRTHWHGPVEHFDAESAGQELIRLERLAAFLKRIKPASAHGNGSVKGKA